MNDHRLVLVTGASGFVGRHLIAFLRSRCDVVGWSRSPAPADLGDGVRWARVDVTRRDDVRAALRALQPQAVYHLAGVSQVDRARSDPAEALETNVIATHFLLDGLRRINPGARVVISGSAMVYAPSSAASVESDATIADSPYGLSKLAQETLALKSAAEDGLHVVVARAFNHTGPGQAPTFVAPSMARQIAQIERGHQAPVVKVGNLDALRDLTDVRDVVRAYGDLMTLGRSGEIYNVSSGVGRSIRSVLDTLLAAAAVPIRVEIDPQHVRAVEKPALIGDASKLHALSGWSPGIPWERTLTDLLEYWRSHP